MRRVVPVGDDARRVRVQRRGALAIAALLVLGGCAGELAAFAALAFSMSFGAWLLGRDRARRSLHEAEWMRLAIASGQHRGIEDDLRKQLALAAAGEAVSDERQWLARAQLGGLLVAEWRLDEAREIYGDDDEPRSPQLAASWRCSPKPRPRRDACLGHVPITFRRDVQRAWHAVEGLCLVRMGRAREAVPLLESGVQALAYNPALVVYLFHLGQAYEHIGERQLAGARYVDAMNAFPGTRLASEARARTHALEPGASEGMFRRMLPEAPTVAATAALVPAAVPGRARDDDDD